MSENATLKCYFKTKEFEAENALSDADEGGGNRKEFKEGGSQ